MTPEQQKQLNDLQNEVNQLREMLNVIGMPYELKELIRNEVIKNEDSTQELTEVYNVVAGSVTAPKAFTGALVLKWKGKEYIVPYL